MPKECCWSLFNVEGGGRNFSADGVVEESHSTGDACCADCFPTFEELMLGEEILCILPEVWKSD